MQNKDSKNINIDVLVSVIIPTFNAKERLSLLLKSLINQSDNTFEIIVVDDGSNDGTREVVETYLKNHDVSLSYYYLDNTDIFGAGIARNHGAKHARGSVLLFIDQDCIADKNLIKNHILHHKTKDIILGYYAGYNHKEGGNEFSKLADYVNNQKYISLKKDFRDNLFRSNTNNAAWKCFVSAHFSIKTKLFNNFRFDESFIQWGCEDIDLGYRLFLAKNTIHFVKECTVYNSSPEPTQTKAKFITLAKSLIHMYRKHKTEELMLYCFERFYHTPLKFRNSHQLIFKNNTLRLCRSQTKIVIDKTNYAMIRIGPDLLKIESSIRNIASLITNVHFDISVIKSLNGIALSDFINCFHQLIRIFREKGVNINLNDIRKQSLLANVRLVGPEALSIFFYNKCNLQCLFCPINSPLRKKKRFVPHSLNLKTLKIVLDQAYEMGVETIHLSADGEPFSSPDTHTILNIIAKYGFKLHIFTNGTILKKNQLIALDRIHKETNILVHISAAKKETYKNIHNDSTNSFDLVLKNLSILSKLKRKKIKRNEVLSIGITFIITKLNSHELPEILRVAKRSGTDYIHFNFAVLEKESKELLLNKDELKILKNDALKAKREAVKLSLITNIDEILSNVDDEGFKVNNDIQEHTLNLTSKNCYNGWFFGRINSRGEYFICCREAYKVGDIHKNTFKDIFFSNKMKNLLNEGTSGISMKSKKWHICNYCSHLTSNNKALEWLKNS